MTTQSNLDLSRYMGEWYEIAKYPFKWETKCETAKAIYSLNDDGTISVTNQCLVQGKSIYERSGTARPTSDSGKLKLKFDDGLPADSEGDYWVHWTDYQNSIVGGPTGEFLWWLSRKPTVKASEVEPFLSKIREYGYDTDKLVAHPSVVVP